MLSLFGCPPPTLAAQWPWKGCKCKHSFAPSPEDLRLSQHQCEAGPLATIYLP